MFRRVQKEDPFNLMEDRSLKTQGKEIDQNQFSDDLLRMFETSMRCAIISPRMDFELKSRNQLARTVALLRPARNYNDHFFIQFLKLLVGLLASSSSACVPTP